MTFADDSVTRFDVTAYVPTHQVQNNSNQAIDLRLAPGQTEDIMYHVKNNTAQELVFSVATGTAITLSNGKIHFVGTNSDVSTTLPAKVGDMMKIDKLITVPANSTVDVPATLTTPTSSFDGTLVGGVSFTDVFSKDATQIPVYLTETDKEVTPFVTLSGTKFYLPKTKKILQLQIANTETKMAKDLLISSTLTNSDGKVVFTKHDQKVSLVPKAQTAINLKNNLADLKAGHYKLKVTINNGSEKQTSTQTVKISQSLAHKLSTTTQTKNNLRPIDWFWLIFWPVVVFLIVFFGGRLLLQKRRR
ncbi:DUF916 domain-containing protein [Weissella diestrammenae]|uniref:DUF916 domain-containing protein n=1 Tax=Weissella diestrammenae TaxID=1162633 RepID=A0A7G9T5M0_9LACO|nr:DUF916 domain-containing protein [Weissella diestrammenae]MCM0582222.1 DUF916 domain-containing protein [Weissella diestrammenae]QNN75395.1 DUF916 domain-containing protein [Weissella diestrammenae]